MYSFSKTKKLKNKKYKMKNPLLKKLYRLLFGPMCDKQSGATRVGLYVVGKLVFQLRMYSLVFLHASKT